MPTRSSTKPVRRRAAPAAKPRASTASRALNAFSIGALAIATGAALYEGFRRFSRRDGAGHAAPDLALDAPPPGSTGERAPIDFRPDPTAAVPDAERNAFRPALVEP